MNFSIDSNILVASVNSKDRLHHKSIMIFKEREDGKFFLSSTVLTESQNLFRNRINQVVVEIIRLLPNFQNKRLNRMEYQEHLITSFRQIKSENPGISNFLDLVYDEVNDFLKDNDSFKLPSFLSELSVKHSQSLYKRIDEIYPNSGSLVVLNHKHLKAVKEVTLDTYFKDMNDERIFHELMTNLPDIAPIHFYTGDSEFVKKINKSYSRCAKLFELEDDSFICVLVKN
ncbi:hypothetical protein [Methanolobus sp.]|uniref:hypothetical protein n=1 Tax=Methanolobus sp. TaxID=1874737 RepID=UPI0025ED0695|nr:hypothetical protein [Methanolobus sp.]